MKPLGASREPDGRAGQALLLVTMIVAGVLGVMAASWHATDDAALTTSFSRRFDELAAVEGRAVAAGAALLRTGSPPRPVARYVQRVRTAAGGRVPVVVEFRKASARSERESDEHGTQWTVSAREATPREARTLPPLPERFTPGRGH